MPRTASTFKDDKFELKIDGGGNPIFNLLSAYSEQDKDLGYTQGMNFIVAVIYTAVQDEVVAFSILQRIMQSKKDAQLITASLPK